MARIAQVPIREEDSFLTITTLASTEKAVFDNVIIENFSDSYAITTNPQVVFGRTDPIRTYSNTERTIAFGILVKADTASEAATNFTQLQSIIRGSYASYNNVTRALQSPPLVRVRMAGYIEEADGLPITGFFDEVKFEYADPDGYGNVPYRAKDSEVLIPRFYRMNFVFHPLHSEVKGFNQDGFSLDASFPYGGTVGSF
jgi:hypothetical protein